MKIIPLAVASLGAIPKQFGNRLKQIGITVGTAQVQEIVLLGTARILSIGCGSISTIFFSTVLLCFSSIITIIIIIIITTTTTTIIIINKTMYQKTWVK